MLTGHIRVRAERIKRAVALLNNPDAARHYVDAVGVWFHRLTIRNEDFLSDNCAKMLRAADMHMFEPASWNPYYKRYLRLLQPNEDALARLAVLDTKTTYLEIARDVDATGSGFETDELKAVINRHYLQKWHRTRESRRYENGNGRTARKNHRGLCLQWYDDRLSKITCDSCFHIEAQIVGTSAIKHCLGVASDLREIDHAAFWARQLDARNFAVWDASKLGRMILNAALHADRRTPWITEIPIPTWNNAEQRILTWNHDKRAGDDAIRALGLQGCVDRYGRGGWLHMICNVQQPLSTLTTPCSKTKFLKISRYASCVVAK